MQVVSRRSDHHELWSTQSSFSSELDSYPFLLLDQFIVLIKGELVVTETFIDFVIALVIELPEEHAEIHAHVWVIMQWHLGSFLYKEKYQTVVLGALDGDTVQTFLEVIGIIGP